jgi:hypothetical protein
MRNASGWAGADLRALAKPLAAGGGELNLAKLAVGLTVSLDDYVDPAEFAPAPTLVR